MGRDTNQIATKGNLMERGFVDISTSAINVEAATYRDFYNLERFNISDLYHNLYPTEVKESQAKSIKKGNWQMFDLISWDVPSFFSEYVFKFQASTSIKVNIKATSIGLANVYVDKIITDGARSHVSTVYTTSMTQGFSSGFTVDCSNLNVSCTQDGNVSKLVLCVDVYDYNSSTSSSAYTITLTSPGASVDFIQYLPLDKCVKYIPAVTMGAKVNWYFSIYEKVVGKTGADTVEVEYVYTTDKTYYNTAKKVTLTDTSASDGATDKTVEINLDPEAHTSDVGTDGKMNLYAGSANQTWSVQLKQRNGSWTSEKSLGDKKSVRIDPLTYVSISNDPFSDYTGKNKQWLQAAYGVIGVQFKVD